MESLHDVNLEEVILKHISLHTGISENKTVDNRVLIIVFRKKRPNPLSIKNNIGYIYTNTVLVSIQYVFKLVLDQVSRLLHFTQSKLK